MKSKDTLIIEGLLKAHNYRLTPGRIALLIFLKQSKKPLSTSQIQSDMNYTLDKVTLYRALEDFSNSKIITKIKLNDIATYYEFVHNGHHHHHIICEQCGKFEDIENCNQTSIQREILKHSKGFMLVTSHSLEFFGICKECSK
jgi:Fur family ferric uptake transcriptional regulator